MDVPNGLPDIKQEQSFETIISDESFVETRPQTEFSMQLNPYPINNNNNNNKHGEEIVGHKEMTLNRIQPMQDLGNDANEPQVKTRQMPQTSQVNSTKTRRYLSGQCPAQWPQAATRLLIELYKKHRNIFESPIINKKDSWKRISLLLASKGYPYTPTVCDNKFRALKYRYNLLRDSKGKGTTGRRKWEFFQLMEELMADSSLTSTKPVCFYPVNYKKSTPLMRKPIPQLSPKGFAFKNRNQNISLVKSANTLGNQAFSSGKNIRTMAMHHEKSLTINSAPFPHKRTPTVQHALSKTISLSENEALSSTISKAVEPPSKNVSNEKSCGTSLNHSVENPTTNGPPPWFVKFQEESLKRLAQIEQMEQRKLTAYEHRNILIDQRTKVLADISKSLQRVANGVEKNTNGSNTTRKDLLMTFSELLKQIEDT